jgi:hypothetical protein
MSWRSHIDKTVKKANSTLGFLRRNLKVSNQDTKTAAYKTLGSNIPVENTIIHKESYA